MPEFSLSKQAKSDILNVTRFTIDRFGINQARSYHESMIECFDALAENPKLGKTVYYIHQGYRRYNFESHAIFYKIEGQDILIVRVLHKRMNPPRHLS